MLEIGVYSENSTLRNELAEYLQSFCNLLFLESQVHPFFSQEELLSNLSQYSYDLFILDVDMEQGDFQDTAKFIRYAHAFCSIILVSQSIENAIFGYAVNASDYLVKPVAYENLRSAVSRILKNRMDQKNCAVKARINGIWVRIPLDKVMFVESSGHNVIFRMEDGTQVKVISTLRDYFPVLNISKNFLRCHKSYVINLDYVEKIGQVSFTMKDGEQINISRQYKQACKSYYINYGIDQTVT